jgi:hypothetical protein
VLDWIKEMDLTQVGAEKIFLPMVKVVELGIRQVQLGSNPLRLLNMLTCLSGKLGKLAEDRDSSGVLGVIGLGARSSFQLEVRLCARALGAYLSLQLVPESHQEKVIMQPPPAGRPRGKQSQAMVAAVASAAKSKLYAPLAEHAAFVHRAILAPNTSMAGFLPFASAVISRLFPNAPHLEYMKHY